MKDDADIATHGAQIILVDPHHVGADDVEGSFDGGKQTNNGTANRGLARARLPHKPEHFTLTNSEVDVIGSAERGHAAALRVFNGDTRHRENDLTVIFRC